MKKFVIFSIVFCVTTLNGFAAPQNEKPTSCTPNESYMEDCNTCLCDVSGQFAKCTLKACYHGPQFPDTVASPVPQNAQITRKKRENTIADEDVAATVEDSSDVVAMNNHVCTPNEVKMEDCNRCKCANNGIGWFCTRKSCPPQATPAETRDKRDADEEATTNTPVKVYSCEPGSRFKDDCNSCKCDSTGTRAACSKKRCLPKRDAEKKIPVNEPGFKCEPNQPFMDDCNSCTCDASGVLARCTTMACDPSERTKRDVKDQDSLEVQPDDDQDNLADENKQFCEPNKNFRVDCNYCKCDATGTGAQCSVIAGCRRNEDENKKFCEPNQEFVSGSFNCTCDQTGNAAFCTKGSARKYIRDKRDVAEDDSDKCVPGARWFDGCNNCWCTSTGFAACTLKACFETPIINNKTKRSDPKCEPGTSWKKDCNHCWCTETGIAACTLRGCLSGNTFDVQPVNPATQSQSAQDDIKEDEPKRVVSREEYESATFTCTPLESFKLECNNCKCAESGKTAKWCTRKFCSQNN